MNPRPPDMIFAPFLFGLGIYVYLKFNTVYPDLPGLLTFNFLKDRLLQIHSVIFVKPYNVKIA